MTRLRKGQSEQLLESLESATSGPLEEITVVRDALGTALRVVLDQPTADWPALVDGAAKLDRWPADRALILQLASTPNEAPDPEAVLSAMWDLVTELNERRSLS